jgi:hypothetical protein
VGIAHSTMAHLASSKGYTLNCAAVRDLHIADKASAVGSQQRTQSHPGSPMWSAPTDDIELEDVGGSELELELEDFLA